MNERRTPGSPNRLIGETSPYLLQHAYNPVDWYPWGESALSRARSENRLILLSIGYAACHWCHVMERESFENAEIAATMNENFVNIKVDREERPDLDEIYMAATVSMNQGQGGWPMTVFLTPELEPVFAGTYFPPVDRYGRPGFTTLLKAVASAWRDDPDGMRRSAAAVTEHLRERQAALGPPMSVDEDVFRRAIDQYWASFDATYGGFGPAPKFPPATGLSLLLRLHDRFGDDRALKMASKTLDAMALGGLHDHLGGGFARYSTDREWLVPHFEKMLYDNALLATAYLEAYQATGIDLYRRTAMGTLDYVAREMTSAEGAFYSSTDADSEGEEGKFFVWTLGEVRQVLGRERAGVFAAAYDVTDIGNWEGKNILHLRRPLDIVATEFGVPESELRGSLDASRRDLYEARAARVPPAIDDKVITAWNGLMIGAFAAGYRVLGEPCYLSAATRAADFICANLVRTNGSLLRTYRAGRAHVDGCLEDYAYLSEGLIDLYEVSGVVERLRTAERLLQRIQLDFADDQTGAFFSTGRDHERLLLRHRDGADGATPAPNAVAASALARMSYHLGQPALREVAARSVEAYGSSIAKLPRAFAKSLSVMDFMQIAPVELVLVGKPEARDTFLMRREIARCYLPRRVEASVHPEDMDGELPLLRHKTAVEGKATLYVCRNYACDIPITDPEAVLDALTAAAG